MNAWKQLSGVLLLGLSVIGVAKADQLDDIQQKGVLKVAVPQDFPPFGSVGADMQPHGYDIDMARSLGEALQLKVSFVPTSWPTLSADLAADNFDIAMGGVTATPGREAQFALSTAVVKNGKIALANCAKAKDFPSLEAIDRKEVRVIVNPGGTNQSYVDGHIKQAQIIRTQNNVANLQGIRDSDAEIMFTDLIEGDYYQSKEPGVFCVATPEVLPGTASYKVYMMSKDNQPLLEAVNQWLAGDTKTTLAKQWQISE